MGALRSCKVSTCRTLSKEKWVTSLPLTVALVGCPWTPSTRSVLSGGQEYPCVGCHRRYRVEEVKKKSRERKGIKGREE